MDSLVRSSGHHGHFESGCVEHQRVPGVCFDCGKIVNGLGSDPGISWISIGGQLVYLAMLEH